ncbi:Mitochondrial import inner membrane translocase subunit TIM8 [Golovinomyces cichoracearum]|uniref:Mitochondrial import inner membrane translocase subunit n=1 Tax=Golovinomyces cichoracearum TaxID=62708 RepID=A0A420I7F6_9PEZI|nr:Mitochondrial import inner membrane translocase subunit TIM8 [Golovinomyces cichoracearum]
MTSQAVNLDFSKLTDKDKKELQQFIASEEQKAIIQSSIHNLTDVCWKKCITGTIRNGKLDNTEETCAQNCVERFMDSKFCFLKHLEKLRQSS